MTEFNGFFPHRLKLLIIEATGYWQTCIATTHRENLLFACSRLHGNLKKKAGLLE
jgi:hypothetical protein